MTPVLVYDAETTGLPLYSDPSSDPRQPHLVQLAGLLIDLETANTIASMDVIVRPDGWTIPEETTQIHGISTELACDVGVPEAQAVDMFLSLWGQGRASQRQRVAHNESFDARILRIAVMRYRDAVQADHWKAGLAACTQRLSSPILKLGKTPNLGEAYRGITGKELVKAHTALGDATACAEVYLGILARSNITA